MSFTDICVFQSLSHKSQCLSLCLPPSFKVFLHFYTSQGWSDETPSRSSFASRGKLFVVAECRFQFVIRNHSAPEANNPVQNEFTGPGPHLSKVEGAWEKVSTLDSGGGGRRRRRSILALQAGNFILHRGVRERNLFFLVRSGPSSSKSSSSSTTTITATGKVRGSELLVAPRACTALALTRQRDESEVRGHTHVNCAGNLT